MAVSFFNRRKLASFALMGSMLALAGCQSGNPLSALTGAGSGNAAPQQAAEGRITVQELTAYCPAAAVRDAQAVTDTYARGGQDDPTKLIHRAALTDVTRSCVYQAGSVSITVAVAGRIVPGPAGTTGTVRLPLRVVVMRDAEEILSRNVAQEVAVNDTIGATQFIFTETLSIPTPTARNIRIFAGFETPTTRR